MKGPERQELTMAAGWSADFRQLAQHIPFAVIVAEADQIVYANQRFFEQTGYSAKDILQCKLTGLLPQLPSDHLTDRQEPTSGMLKLKSQESQAVTMVSSPITLVNQRNAVIITLKFNTHPHRESNMLGAVNADVEQLLRNIADIFYHTDVEGKITLISASCQTVLGFSQEEMLGKHMSDFFVTPGERNEMITELRAKKSDETILEAKLLHKNGNVVWLSANVHLLYSDGVFCGVQGIARDITKRREREDALAASEAQYRTLYEMTNDAVMLLDNEGFFDCNTATVTLFGCAGREDFCSQHPATLSPELQPDGQHSAVLANKHIEHAFKKGSARFEWLHQRADNQCTFHADVQLDRLTIAGRTILQAVVRDISRSKKQEAQVMQLAFYDSLTGLPNRRLLEDRFAQAIAAAKRSGQYSALIFLDLDNFKAINDEHGHSVGDLLLIQAAQKMKQQLRDKDTISRFGGDEFVVLLEDLDSESKLAREQAIAVAHKIRLALNEEFNLVLPQSKQAKHITCFCTASIGVEVFSGVGVKQREVFAQADSAMYLAKRNGRNSVCAHE